MILQLQDRVFEWTTDNLADTILIRSRRRWMDDE